MRTLLSPQLKRRIQQDARGVCNLAALVNLSFSQLSTMTRDQVGIGPVVRARIVKLGALLGVAEGDCFREVPR